jgi:WD40 repeat protein
MREPNQVKEVAASNERSLSTLVRAITFSEGNFALILVRCNYEVCKEQMWRRLQTLAGVTLSELVLRKSIKSLYTPIVTALAGQQTSALVVFGLESVTAIDQVLISTNQVRDEFRKTLTRPIVLWVTDEVLQKLTRFSPDFKSWAATSIKFELSTERLLALWQQTTDELFATLLGHDLTEFLPNDAFHLAPSYRRRQEIESALRDLTSRGISLAPAQWATWQFIVGRDAFSYDQFDLALQQYRQSLSFWQQEVETEKGTDEENLSHPKSRSLPLPEVSSGNQPPEIQHLKSLERVGILLHHIGLCYCRQAELQQLTGRLNWERAKAVLSEAIEVFTIAGRKDLVIQLTMQLGEVLQRLENWIELQALALHALEEPETQNNPVRLAQAYGFLAVVALVDAEWDNAKYLAIAALDLVEQSPCPQPLHQGWYLLYSAKAQQQLGELGGAIATLEQSLQAETLLSSSLQKQPQLYIDLLEELRSLYFEQRKYLRAFELKQQQRSIEQQYGFSTFLGAAPLQPFTQQGRGISSLEIAAAGRQCDVNRLIERLSRNDHKLTIIHGSSGVGKSSLINAGLVPALESRIIGAREAMPIVQKAYRDWLTDLEKRLKAALASRREKRSNGSCTERQPNCEPKTQEFISDEPEPTLNFGQDDALNVPNTDVPNAPHATPIASSKPLPEENTVQLHGAHDPKQSPMLSIALSIARSQTSTPSPIPSFQPLISNAKLQEILQQLRLAAEYKRLTVLIFDQFEEFFFCTNLQQRREFYEFLAQCLNLPFVKIILSLREDYLHYLLECERYCNLSTINNNILDRQLRYHLGDISSDDARNVISTLAAVSQFQLEDSLIAALVRDLAGSSQAVRLIELQVVGQQLQVEKITTLEQYYALGSDPKTTLVERSLLSVINDCGRENEDTVWHILFLLTDERGTRPLKTMPELVMGTSIMPKCLSHQASIGDGFTEEQLELDQLDLILKILVGSGLVFRVPEEQQERYQLVHDYLVEPIRQNYKQRAQLNVVAQLERSEKALRRVRKQRLRAIAIGATMGILAITSGGLGWRAEVQRKRAATLSLNAQLSAISASSEALFVSNKKFDALLEGLRAAKRLKQLETAHLSVEPDTRLQVVSALSQALYEASERNRLEGHSDVISNISFSPDGRLIASASKDKTVKLWRPDGTLVTTLNGHHDSVTSVSFSPNNQLIASSSWDGTVRLWRRDGSLVRTLQSHVGKVYGVSFSPKGQLIASAGGDGTIRLWTVDGTLIKTLQSHTSVVRWVSFSPDGQAIASASRDGTIKLWTAEGKLLQTLQGHTGMVNCVVFSPDGQLLASASDDKTVKLWSRTGQLIKTFPQHQGWVMAVAFSADGQHLVSGSAENTVKLWNLNGHLLQTFTGHSDSVTAVSFSPVSADVRNGESMKAEGRHPRQGENVGQTSSSSPSHLLLASASNDKTIRIWGLNHQSRLILPVRDNVREVTFSPDGQLIATAGNNGMVKLWSRAGQLLHSLKGHRDRVDTVSFSPDSQLLASGSRDGTVKLWTKSGTLIKTLTEHNGWVLSVSFSPDGKRLVSASGDGTINLWTRNGTLIKTWSAHHVSILNSTSGEKGKASAQRHSSDARINAVAFSPDGQRLASASDDKTVKLWTADGKLLKTLSGHTNWVLDVSFSPDSQMLASASYDNTVKLWSRQGKLMGTLRGHTDSVARVRFSPSGQILATTSWDRRVQLWRLDDTLIKTLEGHKDRVTSVNWSNDGQALASASRDNTVMVWNLDLDELLHKSCNWLRYYLQNNPKVRQSDRALCKPLEGSKELASDG